MSNAAIRSSRMTTEDRETSSLEMGGEGKVVLVEVYKNLSEKLFGRPMTDNR